MPKHGQLLHTLLLRAKGAKGLSVLPSDKVSHSRAGGAMRSLLSIVTRS